MRRPFELYGAWLAYSVAWLLPAFEGSKEAGDRLPGWQAFLIALSPLWSHGGIEYGQRWVILSVLSASSNLVMIGSPILLFRPTRRTMTIIGSAAIAAIVINAHWPLTLGTFETLRIGYYVWWVSFVVLTISIWRMKFESDMKGTGAQTTR